MRPQTPLITADAVIELRDRPGRPIVLIERRHEPLGWALPGGFVDIGETVEHAALREAREETGLDVRLEALLGCYSKPDRDPRGHTVSIIFVAVASGDPVAGDDAREVGVFDPGKTPPLAFDHQQVLADFIRWRERR
ncbi:MAG: NUDIX hydrolase [Chromatiales bacterium]|nr:NUDIX hydrolase [Chromatiales bacterium]PLX56608.1 MAG: NUDIX hydrolase [Chromatiales bacterium]